MSHPSKTAAASFSIRPYMIVAAVVWTLYIGATIMFALQQSQRTTAELAVSQARVSFAKDVLYRRWVAGHGGVYVPATATTPPNSYLSHIPERDITTPSGRRLTLINSSYMTRQVQEQGSEAFAGGEHIASLKPTNPVNVPDQWEASALKAFEQGAGEVYAPVTMGGKPYLRFMRPFVTEKSCLKCHAAQGYKEGDIRGGISISQPLHELLAMTGRNNRLMCISQFLLWLLGMGGIGFTYHTIQKRIIENRRTETEAREAKEFLENVFRTSGDGIIVTDALGYVKNPNDTAIKMFGYTAQELTGMHMAELSPDRYTIGDSRQLIERLLQEGFIENYEVEYKRKDGTVFSAESNISKLKDAEGNLIGAISSIRDITGRKADREKLKEAKEQLEKFIENSIDPIIMADGKGHVVKPNKAFLDMIGYAEEEVMGKPTYSLSVTETGVYKSTAGEQVTISDDFFKETITWVEQLIEKGKISGWQSYYMHKSHTVVPITQNIIVLGNNRGESIGSFSIIRDLTEQRKAEAELRSSEERFRAIAESSIDAIITADTQSRITFCNPAAERMFGYSMEELIGLPGNMLVAERFRDHDRSGYQHILQKNMPHLAGKPVEACGLRKDRQEFPAEISVTTYTIDNNIYFTSTIHDISERKKFEEQIRQSQKMEAIGTLAGGIAHDFNNILAAIIGFTEMSVQKLEENTTLKRNLEQVLKSSYRARDLIKQILTFSRKSFEDRKPVEISPIIKEALKLLRASIPTTIDIKVNINGSAGMVNADPTQMHQVLMNLCTNAAHAMRNKGGVLAIGLSPVVLDDQEITSYPELQPGAYLQLTVRDSGAGIDPAIIDRIFEPFFTTKEVGQGTGMGLAVVHGIVKSHGGAITVDSKPGKETAFHILLPQVEEKKEEIKDEITIISKGTECILYVDDEDALVDLGQEMLESLGYRVTAKNNSGEALAAFKTDPHGFDIVITDQTMPSMTGIDLAKEIMNIRPDIPVILCTGHSDQVTREMAQGAGVKKFVMKPMSVQTLAEAIRTTLDNRLG